MRFDLRKTGAWLAIVSLIFWCSCERHHVGELPDEHATAETKATTHEPEMKPDDSASPAPHSHAAGTPASRNSPANFFPEKKKP